MIILTIVNSVVLGIILLSKLIFEIRERLTIEWDTTFWEKKKFGFHITRWEHRKSQEYLYSCNSGKNIFNVRFRNPDKLSDNIKKAKRK